jgi:hypothetical protein
MAADPIIYCLDHLTDYAQFERLCHDLMAASGYTAIEPLGGTKDKGRDALHVDHNNRATITVFAYSVREDWQKKLDEDCDKIRKHGHACHRLVFLCTADFTVNERDNAIKAIQEKYSWELDLFGLERLRTLLTGAHPYLIAKHPQIFCPPFFPAAGGVSLAPSRDYLIMDFADADEPLATWLARRLTIEGYDVWCRSIAPVGGTSLHETIGMLIKNRAFRFLPVLSPASITDPDLSARRAMAAAVSSDMLLPIVAASFEKNRLDAKTRALEFVHFEDSWATGLKLLLDVLTAAQCPRSASGGIGIALRSFMPPDVISHQAEILYSNRFQPAVPDAILRYTTATAIEDDRFYQAQLQWAFRRVDPHNFLAFHPPPDALWDEFGIRTAGGASWSHVPAIDGILTHHLAPELLRKSLIVECIKRGLKFCNQSHLLYFPQGLVPSDRLYFRKPDGSKSFVNAAGRRTYWRPHQSIPYRYHLAPVFSAETLPSGGLGLFMRVRLRLTDDNGIPLKGRTIVSRRKPLCKYWWNDDWFHRMLAIVRFLSDDGTIVIGPLSSGQIVVNAAPDSWEVPIRVEEGRQVKRDEALTYGSDDEDEADDE